MKIAHVSSEYYPTIGGVGQVVKELAERQVSSGHEVHVFTSDWDKEKRIKKSEEIINGVFVHRCYHIARVANFATIWPSIFFELLTKNFDIIHSHAFGHVHSILASYVAKLKGTTHIHTTHCPWTDANRSTLGRLGVIISYNFFSRLALKLTDKIIAITPWEFNFLKKFGAKDNQIVNIPNGMSELFFIKIKDNKFKKKHKINSKEKLVLFFGRLNITKGPDNFVQIAKLILKERRDVTFVIRGPDEGMRKTVRKLIGGEKKIILLPETRDRRKIIEMYQSADVFVLPSFREGLPLTLFEAMASGLPIVASPVNGIPYEMSESENGFLVNYGDNETFKVKILKLLNDKNLSERISKNNIKKAQNYKWDKISEKTIEIYQQCRKK